MKYSNTSNNNTQSYSGGWEEGVKHGNGRFRYQNGDLYIGPMSQGKRHGIGYMKYKKGGQVKQGEWKEGSLSGELKTIEESDYEKLYEVLEMELDCDMPLLEDTSADAKQMRARINEARKLAKEKNNGKKSKVKAQEE
jgi:hypothetical protein